MTTTPPRPGAPPGRPTVIAVVNLKGGTGKTTTTAHIGCALCERGFRILGVDADPQGSLQTWHEAAGLPFPIVGLPSRKLDREILGIPGVADGLVDVVLIDTPPTDPGHAESGASRHIVVAALKAATDVVVPIAATPAEYERLRALDAVLDDVAALRPDGTRPRLGVLLSRTIAKAASTEVYRRRMIDDGWRVLRTSVPRREAYAQSFGEPVVRARVSGYGDAVAELLDLPLIPSPRPREVVA